MKLIAHKIAHSAIALLVNLGAVSTAQESAPFIAYRESLRAAQAERQTGPSVQDVENEQIKEDIGPDSIKEYKEVQYRKSRVLEQLVMMDNSVGKIYPGSFLWTKPLKAGQLQQPNHIEGRPAVTVTFTGLKEIPTNLPTEVKPTSTNSVSLTHNGKFSDFEEKASHIFKRNTARGTRLSMDFEVSYSFSTALQKMGMSAKYFGNKLSMSDSSYTSGSESVAVLTVDQVYYSASVDAPSSEGYMPNELIQASPNVAESLAREMKVNGELAYVRKVDYGRRLLIAITSSASRQKLERAMAASLKLFKAGFEGKLDKESEETWSSTRCKVIVIGGAVPVGIGPTFGGDFSQFAKVVESVMSKENTSYDSEAGAVPVSFELAYVSDGVPTQVFEVVEFSGRIPIREWRRRTHVDAVSTKGADASVIRENDEIDSDDFTLVKITKQNLRLSPDKTAVYFDLEWQALEGERNKTTRKTIIRSSKTFTYPFDKAIKSIVTPAQQSVAEQWFSGKLHTPQSFPNSGVLSNIRIQFDGPGKGDHLKQSFEANVTFEVWAED